MWEPMVDVKALIFHLSDPRSIGPFPIIGLSDPRSIGPFSVIGLSDHRSIGPFTIIGLSDSRSIGIPPVIRVEPLCFIFKLTCLEKKRRRYAFNSWYYPGHRKLTVMLWSHEAPGQFGSLRAPYGLKSRKPVRTRAACTIFWRILDPYGRRLARGWKLCKHNFQTWVVVFYYILPVGDTYMFVRGRPGARAVAVLGLTGIIQNPHGLSGRLNQRIRHVRYYYWTRTNTVRSFKIRTDPLRPRAVWRVCKLPIEQGARGILSWTHFPAYGIMSLGQCIIHWLNDIMPAQWSALTTICHRRTTPWGAYDPLTPWTLWPKFTQPIGGPVCLPVRCLYVPCTGPARASREHLRVSYGQNIVESPCLKVVQAELSATGYTAPVYGSKILQNIVRARTGPHGFPWF